MPVLSRRFHHHEDGSHNERMAYLARDTDTGEVFVIIESMRREGNATYRKTVADFLASEGGDTIGRRFLDLIGSLAVEPHEFLSDE